MSEYQRNLKIHGVFAKYRDPDSVLMKFSHFHALAVFDIPIIIEHFFHKVIKHLTIDQKVYCAKRLQIGLSALNVNT